MNLIAELAVKSNGQRDSFRPAGRTAHFVQLLISQALANTGPCRNSVGQAIRQIRAAGHRDRAAASLRSTSLGDILDVKTRWLVKRW